MVRNVSKGLAVATALLLVSSVALADEVVKFRNGAEMPVRSHVVVGDMVKLDLGGNSYISFPLSMVDKVESAGRDVYVNPTYHPANQVVAGPGGIMIPVQDNTVRGMDGPNVGLRRNPGMGASDGTRLGVPTIDSDAEANRYTQSNGVTTQLDYDPAGRGRLSHVSLPPSIDAVRPFPPGGVGVLAVPSQPGPRKGPLAMVRPLPQPSAAAPAPSTDSGGSSTPPSN